MMPISCFSNLFKKKKVDIPIPSHRLSQFSEDQVSALGSTARLIVEGEGKSNGSIKFYSIVRSYMACKLTGLGSTAPTNWICFGSSDRPCTQC